MYIMNRSHRPDFSEQQQEESAPMITQAAYEYRQRDDAASPATQAEEQLAIGRPTPVRGALGRGETQLHVICRWDLFVNSFINLEVETTFLIPFLFTVESDS